MYILTISLFVVQCFLTYLWFRSVASLAHGACFVSECLGMGDACIKVPASDPKYQVFFHLTTLDQGEGSCFAKHRVATSDRLTDAGAQ